LAGALFKFIAGAADDGQEEVQPGNKAVFAFVPELGTAPQGFVIILS
jgi:hypothetical protein